MNLPNKLTVVRVFMIPAVIAAIMLGGVIPGYIAYPLAALIFGAASFTDFLDGKIARSRGLITDFGKFMDPLADKLLVLAAMLWFVDLGQMPAMVVLWCWFVSLPSAVCAWWLPNRDGSLPPVGRVR